MSGVMSRNLKGTGMIVYVVDQTEYLVKNIKAKGLEWIAALVALSWGYALIQPYETFKNSPSFTVLDAMLNSLHITEGMVAVSLLVTASARLIILFRNGSWESSPTARKWFSWAFGVWWIIIFVGFFSSVGFRTTGTGTYLCMVFAEFINSTRATWEEKQIVILKAGGLFHGEQRIP